MTLIEFMQSDFYQDYLDELDKLLPSKIDRKAKIYDAIINIQIKWLGLAAMDVDDLSWLIDNYKNNTKNYIVSKLTYYQEPDGGEDNIVNEPLQIYFPIGHLIEFFIMLKEPEKLVDYIRAIRIPSAKKYAKEITDIFNESNNID